MRESVGPTKGEKKRGGPRPKRAAPRLLANEVFANAQFGARPGRPANVRRDRPRMGAGMRNAPEVLTKKEAALVAVLAKIDAKRVARQMWRRARDHYPDPDHQPGTVTVSKEHKEGASGWAFTKDMPYKKYRNKIWLPPSTQQNLALHNAGLPGSYGRGLAHDARKTLFHEWAHTRQPSNDAPQWQLEGGAEEFAGVVEADVLGYRKPRWDSYPEYLPRARRKGRRWLTKGQFK